MAGSIKAGGKKGDAAPKGIEKATVKKATAAKVGFMVGFSWVDSLRIFGFRGDAS
jgi:hypothetical protein